MDDSHDRWGQANRRCLPLDCTSTAYFISTCGTTTPHPLPYTTNFENDYGDTITKEYSRPSVVGRYYESCTLIDDHNNKK